MPVFLNAPADVLIVNNAHRAIAIKSTLIPQKTTRTSVGVQLMQMKRNQKVVSVMTNYADKIANASKYNKIKIPAASVLLEEYDMDIMQMSFDDEI